MKLLNSKTKEKKGRKKGKTIVERVSFAREKGKHGNRGRKRQLAAARSQKKVKKETNGVATSPKAKRLVVMDLQISQEGDMDTTMKKKFLCRGLAEKPHLMWTMQLQNS